MNIWDGIILFTIWGHGAIARSFRAIFLSQFFGAIAWFCLVMCVAYWPWTFFLWVALIVFYLVSCFTVKLNPSTETNEQLAARIRATDKNYKVKL